jgi:hypothetical protein
MSRWLAWELVPGPNSEGLGVVLYPTLREANKHIEEGGDVAINLDRTKPPLCVLRILEQYGAGEFVAELGRRGALVVRRRDRSWDVFVPRPEGVGPGRVAAMFEGEVFDVEVIAAGRVVLPVTGGEDYYGQSSSFMLGDRIIWVEGRGRILGLFDLAYALTALKNLSDDVLLSLSLAPTLTIK